MEKVSIIIPYHRMGDKGNTMSNMLRQDYADCEFVVVADEGIPPFSVEGKTVRWLSVGGGKSVGWKRNYGIEKSCGEIILHMDSDDFYDSLWVSSSVSALLSNPRCLVTGLSECRYTDLRDGSEFYYKSSSKGYVLGATMCYYRSLWRVNKFMDVSEGEETEFLKALFGDICTHNEDVGMFRAFLHGNNTASHKAVPYMERV